MEHTIIYIYGVVNPSNEELSSCIYFDFFILYIVKGFILSDCGLLGPVLRPTKGTQATVWKPPA